MPEFEWREAARWAQYSWNDFTDLDGEEQSRIVAHYRCHLQLEAVIAQDRERKRRAAANAHKAKRTR